ncbi:(2Fe-2S)-binding protein [Roseomonas eburnea]|uniref:Bacterioferritin-associated ferredoxin n=2 Tax=Neoroseomonas eburnea TaxID=1346889 RepID=A0A9X9XIM8_9PROT|nr:(2Fe-2S)-binding protein [Neoroseomonas eburnea]
MIICHCNVLTDGQIRDAIRAGARRPSDTYAACGCRAQCGTCAAELRDIIHAGLAAPTDK